MAVLGDPPKQTFRADLSRRARVSAYRPEFQANHQAVDSSISCRLCASKFSRIQLTRWMPIGNQIGAILERAASLMFCVRRVILPSAYEFEEEMEYRILGKTDLKASVVGFGCNRIGFRCANEKSEIIATLHEAVDRGINFFDTANSYTDGASESLLAEAFSGQRDRVIICSKAGHKSWCSLHLENWGSSITQRIGQRLCFPNRGLKLFGDSSRNYAPKYLQLAIEGSLRRLKTDYLDVFYLHNPPPQVVSDPHVFETLQSLKNQGLIRYYGISCARTATSEQALACLRNTEISILQVLSNPLESIDIGKILPEALRAGVAIVGRQPFHKGAAFSDPRLLATATNMQGYTPAQYFLRSALQLNGVDVVLVGMRTRKHLHENLGSLSKESVGRINHLRDD